MRKILFGIFAFVFAFAFVVSSADAAKPLKTEPWTSVDSLYIEADTLNPVESVPLEDGAKYKVVVKGTYFAGDGIEADAKCSFRTPTSIEWTDLVNHYESFGPELLDLMMNGDSVWGDECNPEHTYYTTVIGDGGPLSFNIYDIYPSNNTEGLDVEIYKFWKNPGEQPNSCTTIQSGELLTSDGSTIETGFDQWGYNYQGKLFNGKYCDAYKDAAWCQEYKEDNLIMKWNDAWLSNKDCSGDNKLDRHYGLDSYIGSGAWLTNHMSGVYSDKNGDQKWNYFVKIVAAPEDAEQKNGIWYSADGVEIGPSIWGEFAIIQEVSNDSGTGDHGLLYKSLLRSGLGNW